MGVFLLASESVLVTYKGDYDSVDNVKDQSYNGNKNI